MMINNCEFVFTSKGCRAWANTLETGFFTVTVPTPIFYIKIANYRKKKKQTYRICGNFNGLLVLILYQTKKYFSCTSHRQAGSSFCFKHKNIRIENQNTFLETRKLTKGIQCSVFNHQFKKLHIIEDNCSFQTTDRVLSCTSALKFLSHIPCCAL